MSSVSQNPRPMPKPKGLSRDEVKAHVRAKVEAEKALPASQQIANMLHAVRTTADAQELLNRFRAEIRDEMADFLQEIGTPIHGERTEHERGVMYASERLRTWMQGGAR